MLSEGWVYPGEEVVAGTGRWAVCRRAARSDLTLSAAGEKGKGARGVPQIKEVWGKIADLTHHILRAQDVQPATGICKLAQHLIFLEKMGFRGKSG